MGQIVDVVETKIGTIILRYTIKRIETEVCNSKGECKTTVRRFGVLTSITLPDGRRVRRDENPDEFMRLVEELQIFDQTPLQQKVVCGDSKKCY